MYIIICKQSRNFEILLYKDNNVFKETQHNNQMKYFSLTYTPIQYQDNKVNLHTLRTHQSNFYRKLPPLPSLFSELRGGDITLYVGA